MKKYLLVSACGFFLLFASCRGEEVSRSGGTPLPGPPTSPPVTYTDAELLEKVQREVLRYFWDYAEINSGLSRERYHVDNPSHDAHVVTVGGSGFGLMTILTSIKNGYVSRTEAVERLTKSLIFLEKADRFHGVWPHWLDGTTGRVIPFSTYDNGGDLVETAFLAQGLICVREFFKNSTVASEKALAEKADQLWKSIEWNWYTRGGQEALYWHWSPDYGWQMNMKLQGFDETLVAYVLGAASPTYPVAKEVYANGWARSGAISHSGVQYGLPVVVNHNGASGNVGPMFWSHYSFLGLDPRGLTDGYVNYGDVVVNHAKIMYQYSVSNPKKWRGYGTNNWGLTASYSINSDGSIGYATHSPLHDLGVITPTAALSNMPYTPTESMGVLRFIYNENYNNYVGVAGPYDAYSVHYGWVAKRYLAIDQGTISPMIENHKTQFLWNLFMNAPDIREGLKKIGFKSAQHGI